MKFRTTKNSSEDLWVATPRKVYTSKNFLLYSIKFLLTTSLPSIIMVMLSPLQHNIISLFILSLLFVGFSLAPLF